VEGGEVSSEIPASAPADTYYDPIAGLFERFATITDHIYREWLLATLPERGARAIDLGCGSGRFTCLLAERYAEVLAIDVSERELELARMKRARPNVSYVNRDIRDISPATYGRFDLVFSVNVIHHLHGGEQVLRQIRDLVSGGGQAVLTDIVDPGRRWGSAWWHRKEAVTDAVGTLRRRRSIADAYAVLRLRTHPIWLRHSTTDLPLTRSEFRRQYAEVFPEAEFADLHRVVCAARWRNPA
jgi:2-polyprenyl-3-methyl-5-hydroxy-6-metoxy-1,4-benzoquinol methylase